MEVIFKYKYNYPYKGVETNDGIKRVRFICESDKGIVSLVEGSGIVIIWGVDEAGAHSDDSEMDLLTKLISVLNA